MSRNGRVLWSQGMFLLPHQFQQEARHVAHVVDARVRASAPYAWGFFELELDEAALARGLVAIVRASGILPDGSPFAIPADDPLPPPFEVPVDCAGEFVHLVVPRAREGVTQVQFDGVERGVERGAAPTSARWQASVEELRDEANAADDPEAVQTVRLGLRFVRQRDLADGDAALAVARVVERRADLQVVLDRDYIASQVRIDASRQLSAQATLLHALIQQQSKTLAEGMGQLSMGTSEAAQVMMLQTLNQAEPLFRQHAQSPVVHPFDFHADCLRLAGSLATFTTDARRPPAFPLYRHDDLAATFVPLVAELRRMLGVVFDWAAKQIALIERGHNVHVAVVPEEAMAASSAFVLAVNAQLPADQLRTAFPAKAKLGPPERLRELVNLQLPGIAMRPMPTAPRQLPFHAGYHYFELDRQGELWKQFQRSGHLALHVAGDFPGLELELWAIRQQ